jgi:hypothetical protein
VDAVRADVYAVHGEPESAAAGTLPLRLLALLVGEEVGADESGVFTAEGRRVRGGSARRVRDCGYGV